MRQGTGRRDMKNLVRKVAFVGVPDLAVAESLREYGYRVEGVSGESIVGLTRAVFRLRPAVIHARHGHLKSALVAKLLDVPLIVHAGREDLGALTTHATRLAARTLCGGAAVREALISLGAPRSTTCVLRSLFDVNGDLH